MSSTVTTELKHLIQLALPLIISQLAHAGMGVVDTIMAGRLSALDLASVAMGGTIFWPSLMLVSGVLMAVVPTVSQMHGAGMAHQAGAIARQGLWIALLAGIAMTLFMQNIEPFYWLIGVDQQVVPGAVAYLSAMSWGMPFILGYFALRYLCEGMSWTRPAMLVAGLGLLLKVPFNYWFMYGGLGIPAMGGVGCGWSSVVIMFIELLAIVAIVMNSKMRQTGVFTRFDWPNLSKIAGLVRLGLPIGLAIFVEFGFFAAVTMMIGRLGAETIAAHQIVFSLSGLFFMVPLGLGMATAIRVGFGVGSRDYAAAQFSGRVALLTSLVFGVVTVLILLLFGPWLIGLYSTEAAVIATGSSLLAIVVFYQVFDNVQVIAMGALRGYKDTAKPFYLAFCCYWMIGFPVAWMLGFGYFEAFDYGIHGYWSGLAIGLVIAALLLSGRFHMISQRFLSDGKAAS